eukprot:GAHX01002250.1.p1 GENE.GAHX01002250.1~~GAHX01002250.1.p1  ORF type:complete len:271 (-),score=43.06 GAHX01002250.1:247-1059(-)
MVKHFDNEEWDQFFILVREVVYSDTPYNYFMNLTEDGFAALLVSGLKGFLEIKPEVSKNTGKIDGIIEKNNILYLLEYKFYRPDTSKSFKHYDGYDQVCQRYYASTRQQKPTILLAINFKGNYTLGIPMKTRERFVINKNNIDSVVIERRSLNDDVVYHKEARFDCLGNFVEGPLRESGGYYILGRASSNTTSMPNPERTNDNNTDNNDNNNSTTTERDELDISGEMDSSLDLGESSKTSQNTKKLKLSPKNRISRILIQINNNLQKTGC